MTYGPSVRKCELKVHYAHYCRELSFITVSMAKPLDKSGKISLTGASWSSHSVMHDNSKNDVFLCAIQYLTIRCSSVFSSKSLPQIKDENQREVKTVTLHLG